MNKKVLLVLIIVLPILLSGCVQGPPPKEKVQLSLELAKSEITQGETLQINWTLRNKGEKSLSGEKYKVLLGYRKGEKTAVYSLRETPVDLKPGGSLSRKVEWKKTSKLDPGNYHIQLALNKELEEFTGEVKEVEEPFSVKKSNVSEPGEKADIFLEVISPGAVYREGNYYINRLNFSYENFGGAPLEDPVFDLLLVKGGKVVQAERNLSLIAGPISPGERGSEIVGFPDPLQPGNYTIEVRVRKSGAERFYRGKTNLSLPS